MFKRSHFQTPLLLAALLVLPLAQAATMSKADYKADKIRIADSIKADKVACASLAGNAKDICVEEAKGRQTVARAELEFAYSGKPADGTKVKVAKAESAYAVAREKCDDRAGNVKDVCVKEAKAARTKALADAKLGSQVGEAARDSADAKRNADYGVAAQKCEALSGDANTSCIAAAKSRFGKI
jgi:hypothetical protein